MKSFLFIVLTIITLDVCGQQIQGELKNYSYLMLTVKNGDTLGNGTCFFAKCGISTIVITNMHVLIGREADSPQTLGNWDTVLIRYKEKNSTAWKFWPINITGIREHFKNNYGSSDFIPYAPSHIPDNIEINYVNVNDNIFAHPENIDSTTFVAWGFPAQDHQKTPDYKKRVPHCSTGRALDRPNFYQDMADNMVDLKSYGGMSGSPVFALVHTTSGDTTIRFAGILYMGSQTKNTATLFIKGHKIARAIAHMCR